jgi:hypothetical protein
MLNEQLTCPTPFSRIDQPDLAWRTEGHEEKSCLRTRRPLNGNADKEHEENPAQRQENLE